MEVDSSAPVIVEDSIEIRSDPKTIWDIISDFENWPSWNPEIKKVKLDGAFQVGNKFKWKAGSSTIRSELRAIEEPGILGWTGRTFGIQAVHIWNIVPIDGKVLVKTEESWNGLHVKIFSRYFKSLLEKSIKTGLEYLKIEAEKRSINDSAV